MSIVILGATGDLVTKKIIPALNVLADRGHIQEEVVAVSRRAWDTAEYLAFLEQQGVALCKNIKVTYVSFDFEHQDSRELASQLTNPSVFFLGVAPFHYDQIIKHLKEEHFDEVVKDPRTILLVEKPYGSSYTSAAELEKRMASMMPLSQVYRIDHYLHKALIGGLSDKVIRTGLQKLFSKKNITSIDIILHEKADVDGRGDFYDAYGASRDVFQNHALEMAASTLASLAPGSDFNRLEALKHIIEVRGVRKGQYDGYANIPGVRVLSDTETYLKASLGHSSGISLTFSVGKALFESRALIRINTTTGSLELEVQPDMGIRWHGSKHIEDEEILKQLTEAAGKLSADDAYVSLMIDATHRKNNRFVSHEEILELWRITDMVREVPAVAVLYEKGAMPTFE